jgi:predicted metal-dependent phosphoesterase TrpH
VATVDLHLHTTVSDGRLTPTQLIQLVADRGLETIAITDHDITDGLEEAYTAAEAFPHLRLIPGIEISTDLGEHEIHLLGYFLQTDHPGLQETLTRYRVGRVDRGRRMVEKLREMGIMIEWERVKELAGDGSVGRPHVALAMVEKGYITRPDEAFVRYIGHNGPAYAEREKLLPKDSVRMVTEAGGVAVLAHPAQLTDLDGIVEEMQSYGMVGMEVHYAQYTNETIGRLAGVAQRHGLVPCGGSDYHGLGNLNEPLPGELGPPQESVDELERLAMASRGIPRE